MAQDTVKIYKEGKSPFILSMIRLGRNRMAMGALFIVFFYILLALSGEFNFFTLKIWPQIITLISGT